MGSNGGVAGGALSTAWMTWAGWILTGLTVAMLILSAALKIARHASMLDMAQRLGFAEGALPILGTIELVAALLYAFPRTAPLGAILVTAHLGGAVASHVRVHESFIRAAMIGVMAWGGLFLRDPRLRELLPFSKGIH